MSPLHRGVPPEEGDGRWGSRGDARDLRGDAVAGELHGRVGGRNLGEAREDAGERRERRARAQSCR